MRNISNTFYRLCICSYQVYFNYVSTRCIACEEANTFTTKLLMIFLVGKNSKRIKKIIMKNKFQIPTGFSSPVAPCK